MVGLPECDDSLFRNDCDCCTDALFSTIGDLLRSDFYFLLFAGRSLLDVVSIFVFGCCSTYRSYSLVCDYRRDGMAAAFRRFI